MATIGIYAKDTVNAVCHLYVDGVELQDDFQEPRLWLYKDGVFTGIVWLKAATMETILPLLKLQKPGETKLATIAGEDGSVDLCLVETWGTKVLKVFCRLVDRRKEEEEAVNG